MKILAKIVRVITVPPFLALLLLLYLYFVAEGYFSGVGELLIVGACIVVIPLLAYPICFAVPKLRAGGRERERSMAFVTTGIGYAILLIPTLVCGFSERLSIVCVTYFLSVVFLIIFNKGLKLKASGHACGVFGPLLVFVYAGGTVMLVPCLTLLALMAWSSLKLKRHTPSELFYGGVCCSAALVISMAIYYLI